MACLLRSWDLQIKRMPFLLCGKGIFAYAATYTLLYDNLLDGGRMQSKSMSNRWPEIGKMLLFTTLAATVAAAVLLLLAAFLLEKLGLNESQARIMVYGIYIITGLVAGFLAGKWQRERKFMWGSLAGLVWFLTVLIVSLALNGASMEVKELFPAIVSMAGGGMIGGMLA